MAKPTVTSIDVHPNGLSTTLTFEVEAPPLVIDGQSVGFTYTEVDSNDPNIDYSSIAVVDDIYVRFEHTLIYSNHKVFLSYSTSGDLIHDSAGQNLTSFDHIEVTNNSIISPSGGTVVENPVDESLPRNQQVYTIGIPLENCHKTTDSAHSSEIGRIRGDRYLASLDSQGRPIFAVGDIVHISDSTIRDGLRVTFVKQNGTETKVL